ncbi:MAG: hypothetical protein GY716_11285 [bacterium]|nr:hypothetical protein [bacterium]
MISIDKAANWLLLAVLALIAFGPALAEEPTEPAGEEIPVKRIKMYAENWKWSPDVIRVKQGTKLSIEFESFDAPHAFHLKAYGIKVSLPEGKKTHYEFVVDKAGEFRWRCSRPCGNGCPKMRGKLIVLE